MVFEKLYKFIGKDIKSMMERPEGHYCLRLHKNRVYYVSEALMKKATNVSQCRRWTALGRHRGWRKNKGWCRLAGSCANHRPGGGGCNSTGQSLTVASCGCCTNFTTGEGVHFCN